MSDLMLINLQSANLHPLLWSFLANLAAPAIWTGFSLSATYASNFTELSWLGKLKGIGKPCDFFPEYIHYGSRKSYVSILLTYDPSIPYNNEKKFLLT